MVFLVLFHPVPFIINIPNRTNDFGEVIGHWSLVIGWADKDYSKQKTPSGLERVVFIFFTNPKSKFRIPK